MKIPCLYQHEQCDAIFTTVVWVPASKQRIVHCPFTECSIVVHINYWKLCLICLIVNVLAWMQPGIYLLESVLEVHWKSILEAGTKSSGRDFLLIEEPADIQNMFYSSIMQCQVPINGNLAVSSRSSISQLFPSTACVQLLSKWEILL